MAAHRKDLLIPYILDALVLNARRQGTVREVSQIFARAGT
jgi:hypothetical protein